jgi:hypothetical protein
MIKFQAWADELKDTDFIGTIEPYLKIFCGDRLLTQTSPAEGICPVFGEIEVGIPLAANSLTVKIYEKDGGKRDSFLGECKISLPISDQKVNLKEEDSLESMPGMFCIGKPWKMTNLTCWALGFQPEEDPCFMVYSTGENKALLYESESVRNSSTPVWKRAKFEVPADAKTMHFKFLDSNTLDEDDPIAECVVPYKNGFEEGVYPITEQMFLVIGDDLQEFDLECWANELEDTDWFGKIEPYFTISIEERIYYKSPCVRKGAHPVWPKVKVSISKFFSDFIVKIYDKDSASVDDFLGSCQVKLPLESGSVYDLGVGNGKFCIGKAMKPASLIAWAQNLPQDSDNTYFKVLTNDEDPRVIFTSDKSDQNETPVWSQGVFPVPIKSQNLTIEIWEDKFGKDTVFGKTVIPYPFENGSYKIFGKSDDVLFMIGDEKIEVSATAWVDNLDNPDMFGKGEPYFKVKYGDRLLYKSEVIKIGKQLLPVWKEACFKVPEHAKLVTFEIWDWDKTSSDDLIGCVEVEVPAKNKKRNTEQSENTKKSAKVERSLTQKIKNTLEKTASSSELKFKPDSYEIGNGKGFLNIGDAVRKNKIICQAENLPKSKATFKISTIPSSEIPESRVIYSSGISEQRRSTTTPIWLPAEFLVPVNTTELQVEVVEGETVFGKKVSIDYPFKTGAYDIGSGASFIIGNERKPVEFSAWADGLKDTDILGKIDPYFKVMHGDNEVAISEVSEAVWEGGSVWSKIRFEIFDHVQNLHIRVYDQDGCSVDDFLGQCEIPMTEDWLSSEKPYQLKNKEGELADKNGETFGNFYIGAPIEEVSLACWATGLKIADSVTKSSDPMFKVFDQNRELYKSETISSSLTPVWEACKFFVPKHASNLTVKIYDHDTASRNDVIGEVSIPVSVKTDENGVKIVSFLNGVYDIWKGEGKFIIGQDMIDVDLQAWGDNLKKNDLISQNDCYYKIKYDDWTLFKSEIADNGKYPVWKLAKFQVPDLTGLSISSDLTVQIFDRDSASKDDLISEIKVPFPFVDKIYDLEPKGSFIIGQAQLPSKVLASAENLKEGTDAYFEVWSTDAESVEREGQTKKLYKSDSVRNKMFPAWDLTEFRIPVNSKSVLVKVLDSNLRTTF